MVHRKRSSGARGGGGRKVHFHIDNNRWIDWIRSIHVTWYAGGRHELDYGLPLGLSLRRSPGRSVIDEQEPESKKHK